MAGEPAAIPVLLGLGVTELSMAPYSVIARAKKIVRGVELAGRPGGWPPRALTAESAAEVRLLAGEQVSSES